MSGRTFIVLFGDNLISHDENGYFHLFRSFKTARAQAEKLAREYPGKPAIVFESTAESCCAVSEPVTKRNHPLEHYR